MIRRPALQVKADARQKQRERIGKVMTCVGKEREAVGTEPGENFERREQEGCCQREPENPARAQSMLMMVTQDGALPPPIYDRKGSGGC